MKKELEKRQEQKRSGTVACWFSIVMGSLTCLTIIGIPFAAPGLYYNIKYLCTGKSKFGAAYWGANPFGIVCITKMHESQTILNEEDIKAIERGRSHAKIGLWLILAWIFIIPIIASGVLFLISCFEMWAPLCKYTRTLKGKE